MRIGLIFSINGVASISRSLKAIFHRGKWSTANRKRLFLCTELERRPKFAQHKHKRDGKLRWERKYSILLPTRVNVTWDIKLYKWSLFFYSSPSLTPPQSSSLIGTPRNSNLTQFLPCQKPSKCVSKLSHSSLSCSTAPSPLPSQATQPPIPLMLFKHLQEMHIQLVYPPFRFPLSPQPQEPC